MPVYLLGVVDGCHKIGRSGNPQKRSETWGDLPNPPEVIHVIATEKPVWLEGYLHWVFRVVRINGEWFKLTNLDVMALRSIRSADLEAELPLDLVARYHEPSLKSVGGPCVFSDEMTVQMAAKFFAGTKQDIRELMDSGLVLYRETNLGRVIPKWSLQAYAASQLITVGA